jgi:glycosyltransferase involved in cell wall biosynthesis
MDTPLVSVICPTKDRREFIPQLLRVFRSQTWPADALELVVLDDGRDKVGDLLSDDPRIRYQQLSPRAPVGTKRNLLCELARGTYIVHMDDDDWHPPDRVARAVRLLDEHDVDVVGSSRLAFYDVETRGIHVTPLIGKKRACAGTMAYRRSYWEQHKWAPDPHTEERQFLQNFVAKLVQMDVEPWEVMLCISHGGNTLPKNTAMPRAPVSLEDVITDPEMRAFYDELDLDDW